jgi:hypothetical protein
VRVSQSGNDPAHHGRISKQGASEARHVLVEAAWVATRTAGPLRVFAQRLAARRDWNIAIVAVARKLTVIAWHMLTRGEDYAELPAADRSVLSTAPMLFVRQRVLMRPPRCSQNGS